MGPRPQLSLFELPPPQIEPAPAAPALVTLGAQLPRDVRLGTMSWSYPGWKGLVYGAQASDELLAEYGLTAYARHPLLRAVEIDRTYYEPLSAAQLQAFAAQVPDDFRFVIKAHEDCTVRRFPTHARYGKKRGQDNPRYLDAAYAAEAVVAPVAQGLGAKLGVVLFQFSPEDAEPPRAFAARLREFLGRLPRQVVYAVELRNPQLLTPAYAAALEDTGAVHCHNLWTVMPALLTQVARIPPRARRPLVIRWLLREGDSYQDARARCAPFSRIVQEDTVNRAQLARLIAKADLHGVPVFVMVDNKAEGCAPESIAHLARAIVDSRAVRSELP
jgi:uncharacterized protein YecE (DUF72 family)